MGYRSNGGQGDPRFARPHFSEREAQQYRAHPGQQQHGYGQSQYAHPKERAWGGVQPGADTGPERGPHYGKGPKGYKRSDDRIREEICELMSRQGYIDASDVEVVVEGGVVRLVGVVENRQDKRGLEQLTERIHGVDEVQNEIRLRRSVQRADQATASSRGPVLEKLSQSAAQNGTPPTTSLNGS